MPDDLFIWANRGEAVLWWLIALGLAVAGSTRSPIRARAWLAAGVFAAFGASDIVETHTGAWWRPWWLLVWKGGCVAAMAGLLWDHLRRRTRRSDAAPGPPTR
ncbi:hypothetical protein RAS1_22670 [Phycisphaerae bacterium RAS1]|nr:hypothetical protein RAS1_22670 [Phycisphaerae bacterium RAS1]